MHRKVMNTRWPVVGTLLFLLLSLFLFVPAETRADSSYWIGGPGGVGDWNWASNWDGGIPVTGDVAFIGEDRNGDHWSAEVSYTETPEYPGGPPYAEYLAGLNLTARNANTVELYHSGGSLTIDGTYNSLVITAFDEGNAAYYLSDDGVLIEKGYEVKVATGSDSTGVFVQSGGTFQLNSAMYIGDGEFDSSASNSYGQYFMEGGTIEGWSDGTTTHYGSITLGEWGASGDFIQWGGSVTINDLNLARQGGSTGYYELNGGTLTVLGAETIGKAGTGEFEQYDGTHTVMGTETIGREGTGEFEQYDGTHTVMGNLYMGDEATGDGTYNLYGGLLDVSAYDAADEYLAGYTVIGHNGTGKFNQYDGSTFNARVLVLGGGPYAGIDSATSTGTYNMSGGTLTANRIEVGRDDGKGIFNQTAGSVTTDVLSMGDYTGGDGEYTISNNAVLWVNGNMEIGSNCSNGKGLFTQKDESSVTVSDTLYVGSLDSTDTNGIYDMQGGTLTARGIEVNQGGRFTQQDGSVTVTDGVYVGSFYSTSGVIGTYDMKGGTLKAGWIEVAQGNQFINSGGAVEVGETVNYGVMSGTGTFMGDVTNYGTIEPGSSPGTLTIDGNLTMDSAGFLHIELGGTGPGQYDLLQVNGEARLAGILNVDLWDGFTPTVGDSFDILTAWIISGGLSLGDTPSGWTWELAYLDLNGVAGVDTLRLTANAVPIPGAIWLFAPALIGLAGLRRRSTT